MKDILSVETMRRSDAATISGGISGKELMYRAGKALYESVEWKAPVGIVCGVGNNAGDGYVLADLLAKAGTECFLILLEDRFSEDGRYYYDRCLKENGDAVSVRYFEDTDDLSGFATVVDCIFGTGFRGEVKGKAREAVEKINNSGAYVVAVDINSGLNGDSGMVGLGSICVRSDVTVSIGSFKPGHFLNMAKDVMKQKINCDIGIQPIQKP